VLTALHVRNLAVLAGAEVELGPGLNVLTGETGAGKSIVVDSLALLAGARAASDLIRAGADTLVVTGVFRPAGDGWRAPLAAAGLDAADDELVVRREIGREGRNRVFVNDQPTTLRLLADVGAHLLRIHGQREELGLVAPELQRVWLDRSGGEAAPPLAARVEAAHGEYLGLAARLDRLTGDQKLRQERLDLLRFQAQEIDATRLHQGEEDELRGERQVLRHVEAITTALSGALGALVEEDGAAIARLAQAGQALDGIAAWEPAARSWSDELREARIRTEEAAAEVRRRLAGVEADPRRLDAVEERLALLERLFHKYGATTGEVLRRRAEIAAELEELGGDEAQAGELREKTAAALERYRAAAGELSARRREWAAALARRVESELAELALKRARFEVRLSEAAQPGPHGADQVTFLMSPNPGEELRPIARAASGGELSRLYLAVQLAAGGEGERGRPTMVFDEVDSGIGGAEAAALGRKLHRLARGGQILAVTHLPQVASHGDLHFRVSKRVDGGRTFAAVEALDAGRRVEEVARMLAGKKVTALSRSHAEELLQASRAGAGSRRA